MTERPFLMNPLEGSAAVPHHYSIHRRMYDDRLINRVIVANHPNPMGLKWLRQALRLHNDLPMRAFLLNQIHNIIPMRTYSGIFHVHTHTHTAMHRLSRPPCTITTTAITTQPHQIHVNRFDELNERKDAVSHLSFMTRLCSMSVAVWLPLLLVFFFLS